MGPPAPNSCAAPKHIARLLRARLRRRQPGMGRLGAALLFAAFVATRAEEERGHCTAMGVGRKATSTGSTLLAHTDDRRA